MSGVVHDPTRFARLMKDRPFREAYRTVRRELVTCFEKESEQSFRYLRRVWMEEGWGTNSAPDGISSEITKLLSRYAVFVERFRIAFRPERLGATTLRNTDTAMGSPEEVVVFSKCRVTLHLEVLPIGSAQMALVADENGVRPAATAIDGEEEDCRDAAAAMGGTPERIRAARPRLVRRLDGTLIPKIHQGEFAADISEEQRALIERAEQAIARRNPDPVVTEPRIAELHVAVTSSSQLRDLIRHAYDPLSVTYVVTLVNGIEYLLAVVGQAVQAKDWARQGPIVTAIDEKYRGIKKAGRRELKLKGVDTNEKGPVTRARSRELVKQNRIHYPRSTAYATEAIEKNIRRKIKRSPDVNQLLERKQNLSTT